MKKIYMNPEMEIVEIKAQQLLAGSDTVPTGNTSTDPASSDAPAMGDVPEYDE